MKVFVGNLHFDATEEAIRSLFTTAGHNVELVQIITDRDTGRSRGFGFVTLGPGMDARQAIADLHSK